MFFWFLATLLSHPPNTDLMKHSNLSPVPIPIPSTAAAAAAAAAPRGCLCSVVEVWLFALSSVFISNLRFKCRVGTVGFLSLFVALSSGGLLSSQSYLWKSMGIHNFLKSTFCLSLLSGWSVCLPLFCYILGRGPGFQFWQIFLSIEFSGEGWIILHLLLPPMVGSFSSRVKVVVKIVRYWAFC